MILDHLVRIRNEIDSVRKTILDPRIIKSMDDYYSKIGYLTGLQKSLELFSERNIDSDEDIRIIK